MAGSPENLRLLVVDHDQVRRDSLAAFLTSNSGVGDVFVGADAAEALLLLDRLPVDAIYMETDLPGLSGLDLAWIVRQSGDPPKMVFVADGPSRAVEAFEMDALDFVVRSAGPQRLTESLNRLRAARGTNGNRPPQAAANRLTPLLWLEAQGSRVQVHTATGSRQMSGPFSEMVEKLAAAGVIRIHRSYAVRVAAISELRRLGKGYSVIVDGQELPVARRCEEALKAKLGGTAECRAATRGRSGRRATRRSH